MKPKDQTSPAAASPVSTAGADVTATGANADAADRPGRDGRKERTTYTLRPAETVRLPKRAAGKVKKWAKLKERAAATYAEMRRIEKALLTGPRRLLEPGVVYDLPVPLRIGDKLRSALGWVDQFAEGQASKTVTINQFEPKWWVSGPKEKVAKDGAE